MGSNRLIYSLQSSWAILRVRYNLYADLEESVLIYYIHKLFCSIVSISRRLNLLARIPARIESVSSILGNSYSLNLSDSRNYVGFWNKFDEYLQCNHIKRAERSNLRTGKGMGGRKLSRIYFGKRSSPQNNLSGKRISKLIICRENMVRERNG